MLRTPFAVHRQISLAVSWYGSEYDFYRLGTNAYGEPLPEQESSLVQTIEGVYHASEQNFIELFNSEGTSVKSKINKGILCDTSEDLEIQQGDYVIIDGGKEQKFYVTAVEPILYSDQIVAYEISLEEFVGGNSL